MTNHKNSSRSTASKYVFVIVCVIAVCVLSFTVLHHHDNKNHSQIESNQKYE